MISSSSFLRVNSVDVLKALRTGAVALGGAFVAGALNAAPALVTKQGIEPKALIASIALAGFTAAFDLIRRFFVDYGAAQ